MALNIFKNSWKKLDELSGIIRTLYLAVGILLFLNLLCFWGWKSAPQRLRIYLPPDLSQGAIVKPGAVPKNTVYAFAYQIFTAVNTWSDNGQKDYKRNINSYKNYLSARLYSQLLEDYGRRAANGALSRKRIMSGVTGSYDPKNVRVLGDGTWLVDMQFQIMELVGSSVVKNVIMDYPLIVSRINESIQINPWGLAITGYYKEPYRVKTVI